jgi:protein-tyrosine-phosphatase
VPREYLSQPYAEFRARVLGLDASSFGWEAGDAVMADPIATFVGRERSIDLTGHRARSVVFERGDLIIAMEPW